jgi:hypothetical protein
MSSPGLFLAVCALFLTADSLARPSPIASPPCRFTLERGVQPEPADDADEIWVLTCHRGEAAAPAVHNVSLRRAVLPSPAPAGG